MASAFPVGPEVLLEEEEAEVRVTWKAPTWQPRPLQCSLISGSLNLLLHEREIEVSHSPCNCLSKRVPERASPVESTPGPPEPPTILTSRPDFSDAAPSTPAHDHAHAHGDHEGKGSVVCTSSQTAVASHQLSLLLHHSELSPGLHSSCSSCLCGNPQLAKLALARAAFVSSPQELSEALDSAWTREVLLLPEELYSHEFSGDRVEACACASHRDRRNSNSSSYCAAYYASLAETCGAVLEAVKEADRLSATPFGESARKALLYHFARDCGGVLPDRAPQLDLPPISSVISALLHFAVTHLLCHALSAAPATSVASRSCNTTCTWNDHCYDAVVWSWNEHFASLASHCLKEAAEEIVQAYRTINCLRWVLVSCLR